MKKLNWQPGFMELVKSRESTPFAWGSNDCISFTCDAIEVMTGQNPFSLYGPYSSEEEAQKLLEEHGGLRGIISNHLTEIEINFASRGDVILFEGDHGLTTGIYWLGGVYSPGPTGLVYFTRIRERMKYAWRV